VKGKKWGYKNKYLFANKQQDNETHLQYFEKRYYDTYMKNTLSFLRSKVPTIKLFLFSFLSDRQLIKLKYYYFFRKRLNLDNPITFNEKISALKLTLNEKKYAELVDKYKVRDYITKTIGDEILPKLLWHGENPDDIPFDALPERFVLKCNHGAGYNIFVTSKKDADIVAIRKQLKNWLKEDYSMWGRELQYKQIDRQVIIEEYLENVDGTIIRDYRIFCFWGVPEFIQARYVKDNTYYKAVFDMDWNLQDFYVSIGLPQEEPMQKPENFDRMIEYAKILARWHTFIRIDLYNVDGKIYFSELTLTSDNGYTQFFPLEKHDSLNEKYGAMIHL
jgi:hypothetical protein